MNRSFFSFDNFVNKRKEIIAQQQNKSKYITLSLDMLEEELVEVLSTVDPKAAGLEFFMKIERTFNEEKRYLLVKIVNTYIKYNFNVKLVKQDNVITYYDINKEPKERR